MRAESDWVTAVGVGRIQVKTYPFYGGLDGDRLRVVSEMDRRRRQYLAPTERWDSRSVAAESDLSDGVVPGDRLTGACRFVWRLT